MKNLLLFTLTILIFSSCNKEAKLPEGFEEVSKDGRSHFLYVTGEAIGNRMDQREAGRAICKSLYKEQDYCEVYLFDNKDAIPKSFPIMNRVKSIGTYKLKDGKEEFRVLTESTN